MNLSDLAHDVLARAWNQDNRAVRMRFPDQIGRVFDGVLLPQRVHGSEAMWEGITVHASCLTPRADLPLKAMTGLPVELQFVTDLGTLRRICAVVTTARRGASNGGLSLLQLTVQDTLALMDQRRSTRVFLDKSVPEIVRTVLDGWRSRFAALAKCFDYEFLALDENRYPQRAFTMQANQSDAAFLRSLLAREGINWCFRPGPDGPDGTPAHVLVMFDDARQLPANEAGALRYHRRDGTEPRDTINRLTPVHTLTTGSVRRASWDHETARTDLAQEDGTLDQGDAGNELAHALQDARIVMPHAGDSLADLQRLARVAQQRHEAGAQVLHGEGGVAALAVGQYNRIDGHPGLGDMPEQREYLTLKLHHRAHNNLPPELDTRAQPLLADEAEEQHSTDPREPHRYTNRFVAVQRDTPIAPPWDPALDVPPTQLMSATVAGHDGQEVFCDELGRVKVSFHGLDPADHEHASGAGTHGDAGDSAWVRVNYLWCGEGFGIVFPLRAGMEVSIAFELGDPSRPMIVGSRYNAHNPPPRFDHLGTLPGNHALSGVVTRELNGARQQQLRFDDTPGQISVQLASEHGHSQINLGQLHHPRHDGRAEPRGQGGELRSDGPVAVRGGQGVLVTSHMQTQAGGHQLQRAELLGLAQSLQAVAAQLGELAGTHQAGQTDAERMQQLNAHLQDWEQGGGAPLVAVSAAAGAVLASQDNVLIGAQTHLDAVSAGHTQLNAGRNLLLRSGALMAAFANAAMKLIAKLDVSIESHTSSVALKAAKNIELIAGAKITLQAPEIELISQGAATKWGGGSIVEQASGPFVVKSAGFAHSSGGDGLPQQVRLPGSDLSFNQQVQLCSTATDEPLPNRKYRLTTAGGRVFTGTTDANGMTQRFDLAEPYEAYTIDLLKD